jgi:hypothetical protein
LPGQRARQIQVESLNLDAATVKHLALPTHFDLVKIDVEGYESEVIDALSGIDTKFMYVEASIHRGRSATLMLLLKKIERLLGDVELLACDAFDAGDPRLIMVNVLVGKAARG